MATLTSQPPLAQTVGLRPRRWGLVLRDLLFRHRFLWSLLALTVFAGLLRFAWITQPALWGDEVATYGRTCGAYRDLLDILQLDGFVPLHYELYWAILRFARPTPLVMRLVPALAGTLMVPAMYFLARQFAGRRASLLVAAFAACSAYWLNYSRDAKMYMHFWLFAVLHIACLLWWFRSHLRVAWLGWMAAGLATVGLHASGFLLLPLQLIFLLTQRHLHWRKTVLFLIGIAVVGAGPLGYYQGFNRWKEKSGGLVPNGEEQNTAPGTWNASGIAWVEGYHAGRTGPEIAMHSLSSYLLSFEWPRPAEKIEKDASGQYVLDPRILAVAALAMGIILTFAALGALPWGTSGGGVRPDDPPTEPWWRVYLWLALWIIVPTYGFFYLRSVEDFVSPTLWLERLSSSVASLWGWARGQHALSLPLLTRRWGITFQVWWLWSALVLVGGAIALQHVRLGPVALPLFLVVLVTVFFSAVLLTDTSVRADPTARYDALLRDQLFQWITGLSLLLAVPLLFHLSAPTLPQRLGRALIFLLVTVTVLLLCYAAFRYFDAVRDEFRQAALERDPKLGPRWRELWRAKWQSVWMPRYLAVIFPAVAIALCLLLMRLPRRSLRFAAVAVLLGANLLNGLARLTMGTEPPVDRIATDMWAARDPKGSVVTYFNVTNPGAHPSHGSMAGPQGWYYLMVESGIKPTPIEFRHGQAINQYRSKYRWDEFELGKELPVARVQKELTDHPQLQRIIVWERFGQGAKVTAQQMQAWEAQLLAALGPGWRRQGEREVYPVRMYWSWRQLGWTQRREFVRQNP